MGPYYLSAQTPFQQKYCQDRFRCKGQPKKRAKSSQNFPFLQNKQELILRARIAYFHERGTTKFSLSPEARASKRYDLPYNIAIVDRREEAAKDNKPTMPPSISL